MRKINLKILGSAAVLFYLISVLEAGAATAGNNESFMSEVEKLRNTDVVSNIEWRDFDAKQRQELEILLSQLTPTTASSMQYSEKALELLYQQLPEAKDWLLSLGFIPLSDIKAEQAGFYLKSKITNKDSFLAGVCVADAGCVSCLNLEQDEEQIDTGDHKSGICVQLATAYSLVYSLGKRTEFAGPLATMYESTGSSGGKRWKKGFINTLAEQQGHRPNGGTYRNNAKRTYRAYGCRCSSWVSVTSESSRKSWLRSLHRRVNQKSTDCTLSVRGPVLQPFSRRGRLSHSTHIDSVDLTTGEVSVSNTMNQRMKDGSIPVGTVGGNVWRFDQSDNREPDTTIAALIRSDSIDKITKNFAYRYQVDNAAYMCCHCP